MNEQKKPQQGQPKQGQKPDQHKEKSQAKPQKK